MGATSSVLPAHRPSRTKVYVSLFDLDHKMIDVSKPLTPEIRAELLHRRASFGAGDKSILEFRRQSAKPQDATAPAKPARNRKRSI